MPVTAKEVRTIMYSVEANGNVVVHKLPFNGSEKYGMEKLQRFVDRGFTFNDPRKEGALNIPQVIVTNIVDLNAPVLVSAETAEMNSEPEMVIELSGGDGVGEKPVSFDKFTIDKKWRNMNAKERKEYQEAQRGKK